MIRRTGIRERPVTGDYFRAASAPVLADCCRWRRYYRNPQL